MPPDLLDSGWEAPSSPEQGWPRRRFYRLSADGVAPARGAPASAKAAPAGAVRRLQRAGETG